MRPGTKIASGYSSVSVCGGVRILECGPTPAILPAASTRTAPSSMGGAVTGYTRPARMRSITSGCGGWWRLVEVVLDNLDNLDNLRSRRDSDAEGRVHGAHLVRLRPRVEPLPAPHLDGAERRRELAVAPVHLPRDQRVGAWPVGGRGPALVDVAHELGPRRRDDAATTRVAPDALLRVVSPPDPRHDFGREADEPRVRVIVRRAGLTTHRDAQPSHGARGGAAAVGARAGLAPHHVAQHVEHQPAVLGVHHLLALDGRLIEDVPVAVFDALDTDRLDARAEVRER